MGRRSGDGNEAMKRLAAVDRSLLPPDGGERFNRLIFESSPYLLQHAENPVDWRPWGDEAIRTAAETDRPILLSIGYATCHWCHVMEDESFEDPEVAEVINAHFVPVKVDREERPDLDEQYMLFATMTTGSGGWPLNVVLTPDGKPVFAATYIPRRQRMGMPGIIPLLERISLLWRTRRDDLLKDGERAAAEMRRLSEAAGGGGLPDPGTGEKAYRALRQMYDPENGGFGGEPKFPMPHFVSFLASYSAATGAVEPGEMATRTLHAIRRGGIFDQLGFGLHRYSVDRFWLVPHFEKMLYDQALTATAFLRAFRLSGDAFCLAGARDIFGYVADRLASPGGGFCSAEDADSEGEEGRFYLWTLREVLTVLGEEGEEFARFFDVTGGGNFEGKNILRMLGDSGRLASFDASRRRLLEVRERRPRPLRDEKVIAAWNGLMISALAEAHAVTGEDAYLRMARDAAEFVLRSLRPQGRLMRSAIGGLLSRAKGFLEDYAFIAGGLVDLHQATLDERFIDEAVALTEQMIDLFRDGEGGGFYDTGRDAEAGIVRLKSFHDGVTPSGNSVAAAVLLRLSAVTGRSDFRVEGEALLAAFGRTVSAHPTNHLVFLTAMDYLEQNAVTVTVGGDAAARGNMIRAAYRRLIPGLVLMRGAEDEPGAGVCAHGACLPPCRTPEELEERLAGLLPAST